MIDFRNSVELLNWTGELLGPALPTPWVNPFWAACTAMVIGFILAMWGGRVLRVGFVLAFMVIGAVVGKHLASSIQVDLLIGLVIGAGVAGAIGYVLYRWCLGLTVSALAALIVAATFSAPSLLNERQAFDDFRLGVGSGRYTVVQTPLYSWTAVRSYFWDQPRGRSVVVRALGPAALTALVGLVVSLLAPRFASVLATSILGTVGFAGGLALLMATQWPQTWARVQANLGWTIGAVAFFWLFSLMYQTTHPTRATLPPLAAPAPAAAS